MKPSVSDLHVNAPITSVVVAYMQEESKSVARRVFPVVPVEHQSDIYYEWVQDDFWRVDAAERAPGAEAQTGGFTNTTSTYTVKDYAIAKDLPDIISANADAQLRLDQATSLYIAQQLLLKRELVFNQTYFKTGVWTGASGGTDLTGVNSGPTTNQFLRWNVTNSTPIEDIRAQMIAVEEKTGRKPNKLVITPYVWKSLVDHAELLDRIKYTQRGQVTTELLASLLDLDEVLIAGLSQNTANEGQTAAYSFMHGKHALLLYSAPAPAIFAPSAGYTFSWTGRFGSGPDGQRVKRYYSDLKESWRVEGQMAFAMKVVAPQLGVFFSGAVA